MGGHVCAGLGWVGCWGEDGVMVVVVEMLVWDGTGCVGKTRARVLYFTWQRRGCVASFIGLIMDGVDLVVYG